MDYLFGFLAFICLAAVGYMVYLLFNLSKTTDIAKRSAVKRTMSMAFGVMLLMVASMGIVAAWEPLNSQASGGNGTRVSDYSLLQTYWDFREPEIVLTLLYKGNTVLNRTEWYVTEKPDGVVTAGVNRTNGKDVFSYIGLPPNPSHTFKLTASVRDGNSEIYIPLTIQIYNSALI